MPEPHHLHLAEMRASIAAREMLVTDTRAWLERSASPRSRSRASS